MKKYLLLLFVALMSLSAAYAQDTQPSVTLTTTKEADTEVTLIAWTTSKDEAFTVDWGDGNEKIYNIDPDDYGYAKRIKAAIKGKTITIKGPLVSLELNEAGISAADLKGQTLLKKIDLADNEIASLTTDGLPAATEIDLSNNKLTSFATTGMSVLTDLNLKGNSLDSHALDLTDAAASLTDLNVSNNGSNFITLNLMSCPNLEYFTGSNNPELTTVVFADSSDNLRQIDLNDCHIMHFYSRSMPSLSQLLLSNNALMELEKGDYPKLTTLSLSGNYLSEIDLSPYPTLTDLYCGKNSKIKAIDVSNLPLLMTLVCDSCQISDLDISANPELSTISVDGNPISKLDISKNTKLTTINISNTDISYIDLTNTYSLRKFTASNTKCEFFYFNYINPWGRFNYVDIRNNKRMTGNSMTFTLHTLPQAYSEYGNKLLIAGSNGETADTSYPTDEDMKWNIDVQGDGTAKNEEVPVTVDAENTGETVTVTGEFGGDKTEKSYTFTKYSTTGGTFTVSQWTGQFFQQLADVTTKAKAGVAIHITPTPEEGYVFDGVEVGGTKVSEEWFVVNSETTIKPIFRKADRAISFTAPASQPLSFAVITTPGSGNKVRVDWGNGAKQTYEATTNKYTRIDGTAATPANSAEATVTIYGDVYALNLESWGEYGEEMGLWNNKISSIDFSGNNILQILNLYTNPIGTLDVSSLPELIELDASYCELKELDVTHNPYLSSLLCYGNTLKTLDLSKNPELTKLNAKVNELSSIDLSSSPKLTSVNLANNAFESVDVSPLTALTELQLMGNKLTSVDVSKNTSLLELSVGRNKLTDIDLSHNKLLQTLSFNDNSVQVLDLSKLADLRQVDCGGNGMTACDLNQFYKDLPKYPELSDEEKDKIRVALTLLTGNEETPNDASGSDTSIATDKGWSVSMSGNGSGCDLTWLYIDKSANGSITLTDADGNTIASGDKVKRNSPITLTAHPDNGYELDRVTVNGKAIEGTEFKVTRISTVAATFKVATGISNAETGSKAEVYAADGAIVLTLPEDAKAAIFTANGQSVCSVEKSGTTIVPVESGTYIVRLTGKTGTRTAKLAVR